MDTVILDVVIGLVLTYLVLALLVTKVQETLVGQVGTSRQHTLHDMLDEALQHDATLKTRLLENPLIAGLYKGDSTSKGLLRAHGPSAIPSDLFARALLVSLFNDGKNNHPNDRYATPLLFVQNIAGPATDSGVSAVLRGLLGGNESDWPRFESAIAGWYDKVGERANGWFQRKAMLWGLLIAFLLAACLNVNTFQLAQRLAGDPDLRRGVVALGQRTVAEFGSTSAAGAAASPTAVITAPANRADAALEQASNQLVTLFFTQRKLAVFDPNRQEISTATVQDGRKVTTIQACANAGTPLTGKLANPDQKHLLSNPSTWMQLMPTLRAEIKLLRLPEQQLPAKEVVITMAPASAPPLPAATRPAKQEAASAPLAAAVPRTREDRLRDLHACVSGLVGWVGMGIGAAPEDATLSAGLRAASKSLNDASDALQDMIENAGTGQLVKQLFLRDPESFADCAGLPGMTRPRLRGCMDSAVTGQLSMPVGWTRRNAQEALCRVQMVEMGKPAPAADCPFETPVFAGHAGMGLPQMALVSTGWSSLVLLALGFAVTAIFAALGAPFWFDLLGRFVKMRAAGTRPDPAGTAGAPPLAGASSAGTTAGGPDGPAPFSDARNAFEQLLTTADKIELQTRLDVVPASGVLDEATRRALVPRARALKVDLVGKDELSLLAYLTIVERKPSGWLAVVGDGTTAGSDAAAAASDVAAHVASLARPLAAALGFAEERSNGGADERRALAMLYLVKQAQARQAGVPSLDALDRLARGEGIRDLADWPAVLRQPLLALAAAQLHATAGDAALLARLRRDPAPWLDWAWGELGQTETTKKTRAGSNPRVIAYLEAAGVQGEFGDETNWCGAFLAWVVTHSNGEKPNALAALPASPTTASAWRNWGQERVGDAQPGDVVVLCKAGAEDAELGHHAALVFQRAADGRLWVIGGNQDAPGCVSIALRGGAADPEAAVRMVRNGRLL